MQMKSWNHLFEMAVSEETRKKAVHDVLRGKRKMRHVEKYAHDEEKTVNKSLEWVSITDGISILWDSVSFAIKPF